MRTEDGYIIHRCLNGDSTAFGFLVDKYKAGVYAFAYERLHNFHDAEDIAQEVFLTAYKKLNTFDGARSNFSSWLFTIAKYKSINVMRKKKAQPIDDLPEKATDVNSQNRISESEFFQLLDAALAQLPLKLKIAFVLAEIEGLTYEQIAQVETVRIGTVKSRINRARKRLRQTLKGYMGE